ncbi:MAG: bifunctional nuclease family protein [Deltaproteobacteria bacterium]|nr:bifunctional nuclease family protein [Deltaproteobacteria bacterium]
MLHKVSIAGLTMDPTSNTPIIILKSEENDQAVPIWIGLLEATSIASALQNVKFDRPMTHDLFKNFTDRLHIAISKVEVCDLRDSTFFARIYFESQDGGFDMDARPSDAIALALRFNAPIYVDEKVMEKSKISQEQVEVLDESEEGRESANAWRTYAEDFGESTEVRASRFSLSSTQY